MVFDVGRDFLVAKSTRGPILRLEIELWPSKVRGEDLIYWPWFTTVEEFPKHGVHFVQCVADVVPAC